MLCFRVSLFVLCVAGLTVFCETIRNVMEVFSVGGGGGEVLCWVDCVWSSR